jgi:hypothetical protein
LRPVAVKNGWRVRSKDCFWSWVGGREIWTWRQSRSGRGGAGGGFWVLSNSWWSASWMLLREPLTAASQAMAPEAGSGAKVLGISGCAESGASGWSIGTEEGSRFEVREDGALE